jgi:two-component system sensor histidine kinase YesM
MSIKTKILLSFIILVIVPTAVLITYINQESYEMYCEQMLKIEKRALDEVNLELTNLFKKISDAASIIATDTNVLEVLYKGITKDYTTENQITDFLSLKNSFNTLQYDLSLYRIRLYIPDQLCFANENINFFNMNTIYEYDWYKNITPSNSQVNWTVPYSFEYAGPDGEQHIFSAVKSIIDYRLSTNPIGIISVDILSNELQNLLNGKELSKGNAFYLISKDEIIATSDIQTQFPDDYSLGDIIQYADGSVNLTSKDGSYIYLSTLITNTPFTLVSLVSTSAFKNSHLEIGRNASLIAIIVSCLACIIALLITNSMTHRIHVLSSAMSSVEKGDYGAYIIKNGQDEISVLETGFNEMLIHIKNQMNEKIRLEQENKHNELLLLQSQINPDFLFDVLELINNKALPYEDTELTHLINSLSRYYKLILSNDSDTITIADDLAQIKTYLDIHSSISDTMITLDFLMDDTVLLYFIPKLILQPIIENAITHGISKKEVPSGKITIYGETDGTNIMLRIEDDGVGMNYTKVSELLHSNTSTSLAGSYMGLNKIDQRLKQIFGDNYGLSIRSMKGVGTTVFIKLKVNQTNQKYNSSFHVY